MLSCKLNTGRDFQPQPGGSPECDNTRTGNTSSSLSAGAAPGRQALYSPSSNQYFVFHIKEKDFSRAEKSTWLPDTSDCYHLIRKPDRFFNGGYPGL
jgi:hypothetical protein